MVEEVIISNAAFDVAADNYEEFDQEIDAARLGNKIVQSNVLKGSIREYQFYAPQYLLLNFIEKKKTKARVFRTNLAWLSSEPEHNRIIVWKWLYATFSATTLLGLSMFLASEDIVDFIYCMVAGTISLTMASICFLIFIYQMRDEFIFKSHFGNARLFLIENKKPDHASFEKFFMKLQQSIVKSKKNIS